MFYLCRKDGGPIDSKRLLELSQRLNTYEGPLKIPDWGIEIPDVREALGRVDIMPYNGNTIGVAKNGVGGDSELIRRNKIIATILMEMDYYVTGLPHVSWPREKIIEFMGGLSEDVLKERHIYLPPEGGNPVMPGEIGKRKKPDGTGF